MTLNFAVSCLPCAFVGQSSPARNCDRVQTVCRLKKLLEKTALRFFTDREIRSLLHPVELVNAMELAFGRDYRATAVMPLRTHVPVEGGVLLVMPCFDGGL